LGALTGATAAALDELLSSAFLAAALALCLATVLTGGLHLDGLADSADALGTRLRQDALSVMRDHHIGAYGAIVLTLDLLVKTAALTVLTGEGLVVVALIAAGALSRASAVVLAALLPYARPAGGVGAALTMISWPRAAFACAAAAVCSLVVARVAGLVLLLLAVVLTLVLRRKLRTWLGGVTGDALGAAVELTETVSLVAAVTLIARA
jgi:adenosylcobinamide-GDP ribazoletransferase